MLHQLIADNDELIQEIASQASKDNLELGCRVIKNTVFDSAIRKIKQDPTIMEAFEKRSAKNASDSFCDPNYKQTLMELPERLRPSSRGLTPEMTQVY